MVFDGEKQNVVNGTVLDDQGNRAGSLPATCCTTWAALRL